MSDDFYNRDWSPIGCVAAIVIVIGLVLFEGWAVAAIWNWIAPMFWQSAPVLNTWTAIGVMAVLSIIGGLLFPKRAKD